MSQNSGTLPFTLAALSPRVQDLHRRVRRYVNEEAIPLEKELTHYYSKPETRWTAHPKIEQLRARAKAEGLWNLFLPVDTDPGMKYGAGLTNLEYAFLCEEMGRCNFSSEIFNCGAPETGNIEVLVRYGTDEQKKRWLKPLLEGTLNSCFAMTEPGVASSDATNIQASIRREGNHYIINGHKWWITGACHPNCKLCVFMGKTNPDAPRHKQQSMVIVPMDAPGVKVGRPLSTFGFEDPPKGHCELTFENVRVPVSNIILGEGRGFEIAQGRLGPARIHHCMRMIGSCERALELMIERVNNRVAFGKPLVSLATIQQDIAQSRIDIEQARLFVLMTAHMMDTVGNKVAAPQIAMIKVAIPNMAMAVLDRAIQAFGGMGLCSDTPLPTFYTWARVMRIADGPDEVHRQAIARQELRRHSISKL